ncbi:type I-E CRISPR-associated protein Cse1/CasA [Roseibium sp. RKSG952]|uniref:type I-E CRISPR-associated protein Cse1/CasA n=1 Tax=Roseibium sp. RKSG952 TaxID=2529384 RepID=UPI0012BBD5F5|nr:type I-E CRISPR-associated protein Cse1/CasA [Roseibium sp. RKSG952]MTH95149.1 type I-E CRISPR-associated protein Cse1/CasA [Roseibium sp. RKSG952]
MALNLIDDPWIPVVCVDGERRVIAPWQIAEAGVLRPDWPRPDLNIACYEMLIGLIFMADPPSSNGDWQRRSRRPEPEQLKDKLAPFAPAFNLLGDGPRFLQDLDSLADASDDPIEMLFLDSGGEGGNVVAKTGRYPALTLPMAAMALYLLQSQAPQGGRGRRTSLRGGGPLITLIDPQEDLWSFVWANVPCGVAATVEELPWMRVEKKSANPLPNEVFPPTAKNFNCEVFFSVPRRIRLLCNGTQTLITKVRQRPYGKAYSKWKHPCTPYNRKDATEEWRPLLGSRALSFSYRHWLGVVAAARNTNIAERALCVRNWTERAGAATLLVSGWAMKSAKARDFVLFMQPLVNLSNEAEDVLAGLVLAADVAAVALRGALAPVLAAGEARELEREAFFAATEDRFIAHIKALEEGEDPRSAWLADLRSQALNQFDALAIPELDQRDSGKIEQIVKARKTLTSAFAGYGKQGREIFQELGMEIPVARNARGAS